MAQAGAAGRPNQRRRTRKELLQAAARLLKQGRTPSLDEVAEEALVSRATAYRYFPNIEALLVEAELDVAVPDPDTVLAGLPGADPVARLERVDEALHETIAKNEVQMRLMLARALEFSIRKQNGNDIPLRQNRRTPLIDAALAPARGRFGAKRYAVLRAALALVIGTEAMVVCRDVLQLKDDEARKIRRWAIRALVEAAVDR
jgi:AcrR family transcriptional regulator